jgi:hypothetical protein
MSALKVGSGIAPFCVQTNSTRYQIGLVLYQVAFIESVVVGTFSIDVEFIEEKRKATVASGCEVSRLEFFKLFRLVAGDARSVFQEVAAADIFGKELPIATLNSGIALCHSLILRIKKAPRLQGLM